MYPLHEMDYDYIVKSINSSTHLTELFKRSVINRLNMRKKLDDYEKDYIVITLKYNKELSPSYREMLIYKIKEG